MNDAPDLPPVVACEQTATGWRGLTEDGEILNVKVNGEPFVPDRISIVERGKLVGYRAVPEKTSAGLIDIYQRHFDLSLSLLRANELQRALAEIESAIEVASTHRARFNRAMILLSLGRWVEGLAEFDFCETSSYVFMRPRYRAALEFGLRPWQGEDIAGKRLLLIHVHGFGDSIMTLRYVRRLKEMGANVVLVLPPELRRLGRQCAPVADDLIDADYFCSLLMLLRILKQEPQDIPIEPYLRVDDFRRHKWRTLIGNNKRKRIGVAWSTGNKPDDNDYPRECALVNFLPHVGDAELFSVQQQGRDEAHFLGVNGWEFEDFADCAALMSLMDEIITVDTAALHLAGAIGHPRVSLLLSHWASWRWLSPLYENITVCRQQLPGDWTSAFDQRN